MKLFSFSHVSSAFANVIKRFPVQVLIAIVATVCWCYYIRLDNNYKTRGSNALLMNNLLKAGVVFNLALLLTLASDFYSERRRLPVFKKQLLSFAAIAFCTFIYFSINLESFTDVLRILFLSFAFHLLVAYSPFTGKGNMNGFWQFNKALFLRILTSALYSGVLFIGLAAALAAIDALFSVRINSTTYLSLFTIIAVGFNTIFFLAGLPSDFDALNEDNSYPKGLKIFTQFVLIPLMTIYLGILLVYEIKIIILWQMPQGMVSSLILGYAVFGILSLLLVHPIKDTIGNNWIKLFSKFFYMMMIPLLVLLILAIYKRVGHYGITESRYILIVLAIWLSGITIYFLLSKHQNIKVIPVSLSILALLAVYGPQSAFSVSVNSQIARYKGLKPNNKNDRKELAEIIEYLVEQHGLQSLQPLTSVNLKSIEKQIDAKNEDNYERRSSKTDTAFAILKVSRYESYSDQSSYFSLVNDSSALLNIIGYDYITEINPYSNETNYLDSIKVNIVTGNSNSITLNLDDKEILKVDLAKVFNDAYTSSKKGGLKADAKRNAYVYATDKMSFSQSTSKYKFTVLLVDMSGDASFLEGDNRNDNWISVKSYLLIKKL